MIIENEYQCFLLFIEPFDILECFVRPQIGSHSGRSMVFFVFIDYLNM